MVRQLDAQRKVYRIGDPEGDFPVWSPGGAMLFPGRWHEAGSAVIYAAEHYSTAMLEKLVVTQGEMPGNQHYVEAVIAQDTSYEVLNTAHLPDWAAQDCLSSRAFGQQWYEEGRSAILFVPSVVAPIERNVVINTSHPDAQQIVAGLETPVWWDRRLFG